MTRADTTHEDLTHADVTHDESDAAGTVNVAVLYYSATGTIAEIARDLADTAEKSGARVRLRRIAETAQVSASDAVPAWAAHRAADADTAEAVPEDLLWADAVLMGTPTRFGNVAGQFKLFLDSLGGLWRQQLLADKVYSAFTSTSSAHGGQESTLLALMTSFHHFGGIVVAPGYTSPEKLTDGNPYGTAHCTAGGTRPPDDVTRNAARVQAERVVRLARAVKTAETRGGEGT
ncbi:NAD(P)H:quinone oxidoreductase [Streptomyces sp. NPDC058657]|uniref:NAD(P)H:quinone oxidoreductase n=1 Tax=unclassified Streptomyces TaxID=2593676 RepID=UPI003657783A